MPITPMPIKTPNNKKNKTKKTLKIDTQKYVYQEKKYKGQNRPSQIRLSGVPPIMPIKTKKTKQNKKKQPVKYVYQEEKKNK